MEGSGVGGGGGSDGGDNKSSDLSLIAVSSEGGGGSGGGGDNRSSDLALIGVSSDGVGGSGGGGDNRSSYLARIGVSSDSDSEKTISDSEEDRHLRLLQTRAYLEDIATRKAEIATRQAQIAEIRETLNRWYPIDEPHQTDEAFELGEAAASLIRLQVQADEDMNARISQQTPNGLIQYGENLRNEINSLVVRRSGVQNLLNQTSGAIENRMMFLAELQEQKSVLELKLSRSTKQCSRSSAQTSQNPYSSIAGLPTFSSTAGPSSGSKPTFSSIVGPNSGSKPTFSSAGPSSGSKPIFSSTAGPSSGSEPGLVPPQGLTLSIVAGATLLVNILMEHNWIQQWMKKPQGLPMIRDESATGMKKRCQDYCITLERRRYDLLYEIEKIKRRNDLLHTELSDLLIGISTLEYEIGCLETSLKEVEKIEDEESGGGVSK